MGFDDTGSPLGELSHAEFEDIVRGGAEYYAERAGVVFDRDHTERRRFAVDDGWSIPWGGKGRPERGLSQLGTLGGGNHFIELQRSEQTDTLFVQIHTGSRGFGHGLATRYFELAQEENPNARDIDLGAFQPSSPHWIGEYLNAVAWPAATSRSSIA